MRIEDARLLVGVQDRSYERPGPGILESYPKTRAMDADDLAAFLDARHYAVLATSRPDGRAQAAPVAFTVWNGTFWFASVQGARVRNLRARPYASVVVMEGEGESHRVIIAEGSVRLIEAESSGVPGPLLTLWEQRHGDQPAWAAVFIELRPERLFSYNATKREGG